MSKRDLYEVLGVAKSASDEEIKKAYKRLAMKHHPDRNQGDEASKKKSEAAFKEINNAYGVLSDKQKRSAYDQFGHAAVDGSAGGAPGGGAHGGFGGFDFSDMFGDMFGDAFGGGRSSKRGGAQRGADLLHKVDLTLEQAVKGDKITLRVPTLVGCDTCSGKGTSDGSKPESCSHCHGTGQVHLRQGFIAIQQPCPQCRGAGTVIKNPCKTCHGSGRKRDHKTLSVTIPAGVDTGDRVRLTGEGEVGERGGPSGDLYIEVHLQDHPIFKRQESHLYCEVPISFATATLGGEIEVPTLTGKLKLKIDPGTQTGKLYRLRGKGVKSARGGSTGDLLCKVNVETPVNLTADQKKLLSSFDELILANKDKHAPKENSWLNSIKIFFEKLK